jgi:hypothetical protein
MTELPQDPNMLLSFITIRYIIVITCEALNLDLPLKDTLNSSRAGGKEGGGGACQSFYIFPYARVHHPPSSSSDDMYCTFAAEQLTGYSDFAMLRNRCDIDQPK